MRCAAISSSSLSFLRRFCSPDISTDVPVAFRLFADDGIVFHYEWMVYSVLIALWLIVTGLIKRMLEVASLALKNFGYRS